MDQRTIPCSRCLDTFRNGDEVGICLGFQVSHIRNSPHIQSFPLVSQDPLFEGLLQNYSNGRNNGMCWINLEYRCAIPHICSILLTQRHHRQWTEQEYYNRQKYRCLREFVVLPNHVGLP